MTNKKTVTRKLRENYAARPDALNLEAILANDRKNRSNVVCLECEEPIMLVTTHRPDDGVEFTFWAHVASMQPHGPIETHAAVEK